MIKISRERVLNTFIEKIKNAKSSGLSEIKMSVKELDDISFVIYQIMAEKLDMFIEMNEKIKEEKKELDNKKKIRQYKEKDDEDEEITYISGGHF